MTDDELKKVRLGRFLSLDIPKHLERLLLLIARQPTIGI